MIAAVLLLSFAEPDSGEALLAAAFALMGAGQAFSLIGHQRGGPRRAAPGQGGGGLGDPLHRLVGGGACGSRWPARSSPPSSASRLDDGDGRPGEAAADAFVFGMSGAAVLRHLPIALAVIGTVLPLPRGAAARSGAPPPPREHSPLHPHPPAWATLRGTHAATEESA